MEKINSLTEEQERLTDAIAEEFIRYGLSTDPMDEEACKRAISAAYRSADMEPPTEWVFVGSPHAGRKKVKQMGLELGECYGSMDAGWVSFYVFFNRHFKLCPEIEGIEECVKTCGWWWPYEGMCIVSPRPMSMSFDADHDLHCEDGPALAYPDGFSLWMWHGVSVPEWVIMEPEKITPENIDSEANAEVRRVMLDRYGWDRYIRVGGAEAVDRYEGDQKGLKGAVLYRKEMGEDEPLTMVQLINSTPEPDGESKRYYLRVPPEITTAKDAVAWTFNMQASEYCPREET